PESRRARRSDRLIRARALTSKLREDDDRTGLAVDGLALEAAVEAEEREPRLRERRRDLIAKHVAMPDLDLRADGPIGAPVDVRRVDALPRAIPRAALEDAERLAVVLDLRDELERVVRVVVGQRLGVEDVGG